MDYVHYLIKNGEKEIAESQQPFGFYDVEVETKKQVNNNEIKVIYEVKLNKPVKLNTISVNVSGEAKNDPEFQKILAQNPFKKGETLSHQQYEEYKGKFLEAAVRRGYFEGKFSAKVIEVVPEDYVANISLHYESGERFKFGNVRFRNRTEGADKDAPLPLREELLQRFVQFSAGQEYNSLEVEKLQQDLQASGYFKQVIAGGRPKNEDKTVPVGVALSMNKRDHYAIGAGYSTDSGFRGKFNFDRRWVNDRGHTFNSSLYVSQKNSDFDNLYKIPGKNPTTDYYYLRAGGTIKADEYDSRRYFAEGGYNWRKDKWDYRIGLTSAWEKFTIGLDHDAVLLTYPMLQAVYTDAENRLNPEKGLQAKINVMGGAKGVGSDISFVQSNTGLRYIHSLNPKNRFIMRFDGGATWTEDFHKLPPSMRYLTGGDRTIRGYSYEKIGDYDASNTNIGGKYLAVGSVEYEYYFSPNWAAALFVDAGDSFSKKFDTKVGAGTGVHWKSPVGPIKIDFAHGFDEELGSKFRLHLNVGAELNL